MTLTFICINTVATSQQSMTQKIEGGKWRQKWNCRRKFMDDFFFFFQPQKIRSYQKCTKRGNRKKGEKSASQVQVAHTKAWERKATLAGGEEYYTFQVDTRNRCISYFDVQTSICLWKKCLLYVKKAIHNSRMQKKSKIYFVKNIQTQKSYHTATLLRFTREKNTLGTRVNLQLQISKKIVIKTLSSYPFF